MRCTPAARYDIEYKKSFREDLLHVCLEYELELLFFVNVKINVVLSVLMLDMQLR